MTKSLKHKYVLRLDVHLGSSPVSSLSVVTDSVVAFINLIHCGNGLFCFLALAIFCLILKDFEPN